MRKRGELLLKLLPVKAQALSTTTIYERLVAQGIRVSKRTVQRDLERLAKDYPHVHGCETGAGNIWWADRALSRLSLLPTDAMNLTMIMDHAARMGMQAQVDNLAPLHDYAKALLKDARPAEDWTKKLVSTTRFITLRPSKVDAEVLAVLQRALLEDYAVEALYLKRGATEPKAYRLKPLGLSYQDSNIYLCCLFHGQKPEDSPRALPLHRFVSAKTICEDIPVPADFDINSVAARRSLVDLRSDEPVELKLRLGKEMFERLTENPLSEDQLLAQESDGQWLMTGRLHLSQGLKLWVLSQGDKLEVLAPLSLRQEIAATASRMAAMYQSA